MFGVKELSVEHILMLAIVVFLLYHLIGRCGNDGFNVGSRGEEFQWPDFWGDNKGLGSCNKHSKNIDDCHDNNCLYFQEAVTYKPGEDLPEIGKCRSLSTINWLSKQGYSQCKESYKDENGSEIGHVVNLDIGYYNSIKGIDRCETQEMCVPETITKLDWSDTKAPWCESGCEKTRSPDNKDGWHEFGKVNQNTLDSSYYGCNNDSKTYDKCIVGNRSICKR